jgi:hypothetical protein
MVILLYQKEFMSLNTANSAIPSGIPPSEPGSDLIISLNKKGWLTCTSFFYKFYCAR